MDIRLIEQQMRDQMKKRSNFINKMQEKDRLSNSKSVIERKMEEEKHSQIVQKIKDRRSYEYQEKQFNKKTL